MCRKVRFSRLLIVQAVKKRVLPLIIFALVVAGADPHGRDDLAIALPLLLSPVIGLFVALFIELVILRQTPRESFCDAEKAMKSVPRWGTSRCSSRAHIVGWGRPSHSPPLCSALSVPRTPFPTHRRRSGWNLGDAWRAPKVGRCRVG